MKGVERSCLMRLLRALIVTTCLSVVGWQAVTCMGKFLGRPQGTAISIVQANENLFPTITICPDAFNDSARDLLYNGTLLNSCGIKIGDYRYNGIWANESHELEICRDPKKLFEEVVAKPSDFIHEISYYQYDQAGNDKTTLKAEDEKVFVPNEMRFYGRCFSPNPSEDIIKAGVFWMELTFKSKVRIFIHNKGMWSTVRSARNELHDIALDHDHTLNVEHEVYELLDIAGSKCNLNQTFNYDECIYETARDELMKKVGCITPFLGRNKENICPNQTFGVKAYNLQKTFLAYGIHKDAIDCYESCNYLVMKMREASETKAKNDSFSTLKLTFQERIKKTKSYYTYEGLSFVAEFGGYVGLFLGVSFLNVADLIQQFLFKADRY